MAWERLAQEVVKAAEGEKQGVLDRMALEVVRARVEKGLGPWRGTELRAAEPLAEEAEETLLAILESVSDQRLKATVALVIGEVGGANSVAGLRTLLHEAEDQVGRLAAVEALGKIGGPEAVKVLQECAWSHSDELVRGTAAQALKGTLHNTLTREPLASVRLGGKPIAAFLEEVATKDVSLYVRAMAKG